MECKKDDIMRKRDLSKGQVTYVEVGIMREPEVSVKLNGNFKVDSEGEFASALHDKQLNIRYSDLKAGRDYQFVSDGKGYFTLSRVPIGVDFHWSELKEFNYKGDLVLRRTSDDKIQVINKVDIEDYICSVIGSEMAPTCPLELLKAHAIISRSWLVSQLQRKSCESHPIYRRSTLKQSDDEMIQIWDAMGHTEFDVCSDDHCQRYQGINDDDSENVKKAVELTKGIILKSDGAVCDARFSKCCGGISELFSTCWSDEDFKYLSPVRCNIDRKEDINEVGDTMSRRKWMLEPPTDTYCSTKDSAILSRILKAYDKKTIDDFYRWKVEYDVEELTELVKEKIGLDVGKIISLDIVETGPSGRVKKMHIVGTRGSKVIGKELLIRKAFSKTHLLSSAFVVEKKFDGSQEKFVFYGAGWGHGVGMCQIGAAVMAEKGHSYTEILSLYYPNSELVKMNR